MSCPGKGSLEVEMFQRSLDGALEDVDGVMLVGPDDPEDLFQPFLQEFSSPKFLSIPFYLDSFLP